MSFKKKSSNQSKNDKENFKNISISGVGFINSVTMIINKNGLSLIAELALQQGKVVNDNYGSLETINFSVFVNDEELQQVLIDGLFDDVKSDDFAVYKRESDEPLKGSFKLSSLGRVDIIKGKAVIHSCLNKCLFFTHGKEIIIDNRNKA